MVIWLFGLSGAGKTTIGRILWQKIRAEYPNTVFLDGDEIRAVAGDVNGPVSHTVEGRRQSGERLIRLCSVLDQQGLNVVCCVLSIFADQRAACRCQVSEFFSVFIASPLRQLEARDVKGLYRKARAGEMPNVVGIDIPFSKPTDQDLTIRNDRELSNFEAVAEEIMKASGLRRPEMSPQNLYPYANAEWILKPSRYEYSTFEAQPFFAAWGQARTQVCYGYPPVLQPPPPETVPLNLNAGSLESVHLLEWIWADCASSPRKLNSDAAFYLSRLVKKFETTMKIHGAYGDGFRAVNRADFGYTPSYVRFGEILASRYAVTQDLRMLNCLLKLMDVMSPMMTAADDWLRSRFSRLVVLERQAIVSLGQNLDLQVPMNV